MAYFTKFPAIEYPVLLPDNTYQFVYVRNLLRRIALSPDITSGTDMFLQYDIKDGERPEHIAERVYGDPGYHWLVMMCNSIIDPYHDWYKSGAALEDYVQTKYFGTAVYITNTNDTFYFDANLVAGCTLAQSNISDGIVQYDPVLCRVIVSKANFSKGSATLKTPKGSTTVKIQRVDQYQFSVHHFQVNKTSIDIGASETAVVDPLTQQTGSYGSIGGVVSGSESQYPTPGNGLCYAPSGVVDLWETYIGRYMGISGAPVGSYAVANNLYEIGQNDSKRTIRVLDPRYKKQATRELESLLGG